MRAAALYRIEELFTGDAEDRRFDLGGVVAFGGARALAHAEHRSAPIPVVDLFQKLLSRRIVGQLFENQRQRLVRVRLKSNGVECSAVPNVFGDITRRQVVVQQLVIELGTTSGWL